jgi:pimeloyl-ACP methyl ester carboxylesterase
MKNKVVAGLLLMIVALVVYGLYLRPNLTISKAEAKAKYSMPNSHFINFNGAEVHYTESGSGFPVLMIHGFGGSSRDFLVLDSLMNDKYRVIRIDLPGFGLSDFPKQAAGETDFLKVYTSYFNFMLDTLHIDSCYVLGNSLGGMMAWNLALNRPDAVKKLVLFNSAGYEMQEVMKTANASLLQNKLVQQMVSRGAPQFAVKMGIQRVVYNPASLTAERLHRVTDLWNRDGNMNHLIAMAQSKEFPDENTIKNISCPTLIFWGKQDKIVNPKYAERFHNDIEGSSLVMYDSCGHVPMLERPNDVIEVLLPFLQQQDTVATQQISSLH